MILSLCLYTFATNYATFINNSYEMYIIDNTTSIKLFDNLVNNVGILHKSEHIYLYQITNYFPWFLVALFVILQAINVVNEQCI